MKEINCIMLVDDNEFDNLLAERLISINLICHRIIKCRSGLKALQELEAFYKLQKCLPNIILIDIYMPIMDGYELIENIKAQPYYATSKPVIVVISASMDEGNHPEKLNSMNVKWMAKPFDWDIFKNLIEAT